MVSAATAAAIRQKDKSRLFMPSLSRQCLRLGDNVGDTPSFHAREGFTKGVYVSETRRIAPFFVLW